MRANSASPLSQGRCSSLRHWRVASTQAPITRPGSATPIRPLVSRPSAQAAKPARAQPACGRSPSQSANTKHQMALAIQAATPMSWLTYCPPIRKPALAPSIQAARRARAASARRRPASQTPASISVASSTPGTRAAQGVTPSTAMLTACSQWVSGGL